MTGDLRILNYKNPPTSLLKQLGHLLFQRRFGAGEGNRTLTASLEGWNSTVELHPHKNLKTLRRFFRFAQRRLAPGFLVASLLNPLFAKNDRLGRFLNAKAPHKTLKRFVAFPSGKLLELLCNSASFFSLTLLNP
jgi:hypothetical protein